MFLLFIDWSCVDVDKALSAFWWHLTCPEIFIVTSYHILKVVMNRRRHCTKQSSGTVWIFTPIWFWLVCFINCCIFIVLFCAIVFILVNNKSSFCACAICILLLRSCLNHWKFSVRHCSHTDLLMSCSFLPLNLNYFDMCLYLKTYFAMATGAPMVSLRVLVDSQFNDPQL